MHNSFLSPTSPALKLQRSKTLHSCLEKTRNPIASGMKEKTLTSEQRPENFRKKRVDPSAQAANCFRSFLQYETLTKIVSILIGLSILTACDCYKQVVGTVTDKTTGRPVGFAQVTILGSSNASTTDSLGNFHLSIINSGLQCYCKPKDKISISSSFYLTDTFSLNQSQYKLQADTNHFKKFFDPKNNFMNKWIYFNLFETIELKVIHHTPVTIDCGGGIETFSITIGTIQSGDTIRVLETCNKSKDFKSDDVLSVVPIDKPKGDYVHPGVFVQGYPGPLRPQLFDTLILKTTFGRTSKNNITETEWNIPADTNKLNKSTEDYTRLDSIDKVNNETVLASGDDITKAFVSLKEGDSTIYLTANIRKDHRIFGYAKPDTKSERLLLLSVFTNDVENNPFCCRLGAYYDTGGMDELTLKYNSTTGNFVKATATDKTNKSTTIYFEKKWIEFE